MTAAVLGSPVCGPRTSTGIRSAPKPVFALGEPGIEAYQVCHPGAELMAV